MDLVEASNSEEATAETSESLANGVRSVHVSLAQAQIPSVIQPTSVIQTTPSLQTLPTKGNIILVGKSNSVIHTTGIQVVEAEAGATKKRRELLARRPSYRKILNDLGGCELSVEDRDDSPVHIDPAGLTASTGTGIKPNHTITVGATHYQTAAGLLKVIPASAIQLATVGGGQSLAEGQSMPTLAMTNASGGGTIVHYAQGQDGQLFVPVCVAGDVQTYTIRPVTSTAVVVGGSSITSPSSQDFSEDGSRKRDRLAKGSSGSGGNSDEWEMSEPALQKREIRLLKNREAARECRRKKKEYIKCLENRVAVLENQNKQLIEELKSLKELYCNQKVE